MNQYKFDCGCSFPVIDDELKSDGLPKLYIPYDDLIEDLNYGKTCPETWKIFHSGHTKGVFQLENNLGAEWSEQIAPSSLEELSAVISVIRPGTLKSKNEKGKSLTKIFADRKKGIEPTKAYVPALEDILKETYQIIVYQESAIRIAQEIAGLSEEDADKLRKAMGKKDADLMAKIENWFLDGCYNKKIVTEEQAKVIFGWIKESQRYAFNKSHGISYGSIGYLTALVKEHFPLHFYANWIKNARNKANSQEQIRELIDEAKLYNIPVLLPTLHTLGYNNYDVCIDNGAVRFGISSLKGIGSSLVDKTIEYLETTSAKLDKKIEDFSWNDFLIHIAPALGKKTVTALITGGVLPYPLPRSRMLYEYQQIKNLTKIQFEKLKEKDYTNLDRALSKLIDEVSRPQKTKIKNIIKLLNSSASSTKDRPAWIVTQEENLYGMPITYSKMDILKNSQMANTTCQEFIDGKKGDDITLAGELLSFNKFPIKNGKNIGKMMGIGNLHDGTASVKVLFFSKVFAEYENYLYKGNCIYVTGIRNDGKDFIVNDLQEIY